MHARCWLVALAALLWPVPATADDMGDCKGAEPARAVAACTRIADAPAANPRARSSALSLRAIAHQRLNALDKALADFGQAIAVMEGAGMGGWELAFTYYMRAGAHRRMNALDKAIEDHTQAIRIAPGWDKSYNERGAIHFQRGELDKALADISKVISFRPTHPFVADAYATRAIIHHRLGRASECLADADKSLGLKPGSAMAHYMRGKALEALGRRDDAAAALRTARGIDANIDAMLQPMLAPGRR